MDGFLTCDETYVVYEPTNLAEDSLKNWHLGAFRTTDLLVGVPLSIAKAFTGFSLDIMAVFAKSLHWLIGFVVILLILETLMRISKKDKSPAIYLFFSYCIMLLPVVIMAQKIINYDSLSMLTGALAILLLIRGWNENRTIWLYLSIVSAAFAAQEKLIAAPFLWFCLFSVPFKAILSTNDYRPIVIACKTLKPAAAAMTFSIFTMLFTFSVVSIVNNRGLPQADAFNLFYPLMSGFWPVLRAIGFDLFKIFNGMSFNGYQFIILLLVVFICLFSIVIFLIAVLVTLFRSRTRLSTMLTQIRGNLPVINYTLFFLSLIIGISGCYLISAYFAPYYPLQQDSYKPALSFNDAFVHFGARTLPSHLLYSIGWSYAVFFNAVPTLFIIMTAVNAFSLILKKRKSSIPIFEIIYTISLLMPVLFGLFQVPVSNRYFNLFILIIILKTIYDLSQLSSERYRRGIIAFGAGCLLLIEIIPFGPLYAAFHPIWSNYSYSYNTRPSRGILNPWWMGWGEEAFIEEKRIARKLNTDNPSLDGIVFYSNYMGSCLYNKTKAVFCPIDSVSNFRYTDNDYYILNRMGIAQLNIGFPEGIEPFDKICFRGFIQAWVFRGSDLKKHGFSFSNSDRISMKK